ncbi:MAG: putative sigma-54 modulation protein [Candidatus Atribacteria bacterium]|nr:putative sigma-54 modulation protein [Candidatus Atribacteria bacterium]
MDVIVRGKNLEINDTMRDYVTQKLGKLERFFKKIMEALVQFQLQRGRVKVEVTLSASGIVIRGEELGPEWRTAFDKVMEKLERQVKRYKGKLESRGAIQRQEVPPSEVSSVVENVVEEEPEPQVVRVKEFVLRPMSVEDAIFQMELLGHSFFVFKDMDTEKVRVLYRRDDGNYGLIDPIY